MSPNSNIDFLDRLLVFKTVCYLLALSLLNLPEEQSWGQAKKQIKAIP